MWRTRKRDREDTSRGEQSPVGLTALLETERELSDLLAQSSRQAAEIIEAARARIQASEREFEVRLAGDLQALDAQEQAATAAALSQAAIAAEERVARLDNLPERRIDELAEAVLRDFLGIATMTAPR